MTVNNAMVETARLQTKVRTAGNPADPVLVLIHGNVSSGVFFEQLMEELADDYFLVAPDLRGYGGSERKVIDATRGMKDFSDDLAALIEAMELHTPLDLFGWSAGGGVAMQYVIDHPENVRGLILESGMSPYGFGGTKGVEGERIWDDSAGSGGGTANPDFVRLLSEGDRGADNPVSPLNTMRAFYFAPGLELAPEIEESYLQGMLDTKVGDDVYPGDMVPSDNWPGVAPGTTGMNNAISPKYLDLSPFGEVSPSPAVLWIRGEVDQIVSDTSFFDFGYLGQLGFVPGWPGEETYPVQPMVSQLRGVLDRAGNYREVVFDDCGHSPHIEAPERFREELQAFLD